MQTLKTILWSVALAALAGCVFYGGHGGGWHHHWGY